MLLSVSTRLVVHTVVHVEATAEQAHTILRLAYDNIAWQKGPKHTAPGLKQGCAIGRETVPHDQHDGAS